MTAVLAFYIYFCFLSGFFLLLSLRQLPNNFHSSSCLKIVHLIFTLKSKARCCRDVRASGGAVAEAHLVLQEDWPYSSLLSPVKASF